MQAARRVANSRRFGQDNCPSDLEVRVRLNLPSIECRLRRLRLLYLPRMIQKGPSSLATMLCMHGDKAGETMPWTAQIVDDMRALKAAFPVQLEDMPDPAEHAGTWLTLMCDFPRQWKEIIKKYISHNSVLDSDKVLVTDFHGSYSCRICAENGTPCRSFKSEKELLQHKRIMHSIRSPIPYYVDDSGICPACGVNLFSRPKVIVHACEKRSRGKTSALRCFDVFMSGALPTIDIGMYHKLQERDKHVRRAALKKGSTHVHTMCPAKRVASAATNRINVLVRAGIDPCTVAPSSAALTLKRSLPQSYGEDSNGAAKSRKINPKPLNRICSKTRPSEITFVTAKRVRTKEHESHLYRRV